MDGGCSHESKTFAPWKVGYNKHVIDSIIDCILKSRDITLPTKVHLVKAMVFPVVMYNGILLSHKKE